MILILHFTVKLRAFPKKSVQCLLLPSSSEGFDLPSVLTECALAPDHMISFQAFQLFHNLNFHEKSLRVISFSGSSLQNSISLVLNLGNLHYIFIISQLGLTSHPRSTVVLLDTETPGTSREIYSEDADGETRTRNPWITNSVL